MLSELFVALFLTSKAPTADGGFVTPRMSCMGTEMMGMILRAGSQGNRVKEDFLIIPKDVSRAVQAGTKDDALFWGG